MIDLLRHAGAVVVDIDHQTGKQLNVNAHGHHFQANLDGVLTLRVGEGEELKSFVLEVKSMNGLMFRRFKKHGMAKSHPQYLDQLTTQMGLSGCHCGVLFAYCKDDAELHMEFVEFDQARFDALNKRALQAMFGEAKRVANSPTKWPCTMCFKRSACHLGEFAEKKCQHCAHSIPGFSGKKEWVCKLDGRVVHKACDQWTQWRPT